MHRLVSLTAMLVMLFAGVLVAESHGAAAVGYGSPALPQKTCSTKKVHGKTRKVCHQTKPKPSPTPYPTPVTELSTGDQIAAYLAKAHFNGYEYLERQGKVILSKGFGMADAEDKVPNTLQTKWPAFAESRFLVGLAIMKLQEQRKLSVTDAICTYVTGCPAAWQPITIQQLLTNTSGIAKYFALTGGNTVDENAAACRARPLISAPGAAASPWSDCNTLVLGTILERVTGKAWADAMQDLIFGPVGMANSGQMTNALKPPQRGRLYRFGSATSELNYDGFYLAYTTVEDMVRLNHALLAGTLLSKQSLDAMFSPLLHDDSTDPNSPWRGYEVITDTDTATTYGGVSLASINGGGEDDEGEGAGFYMTSVVWPDAGSLAIEINNDDGHFTPGDDNDLGGLTSKLMQGK